MKSAFWMGSLLLLLTACNKDETPQPPAPQPSNPAFTERNLSYGLHPRQRMGVFAPEGYNAQTPVVFLMHPGGFYEGSKESFEPKALLFRDEGFVVVNLNYRLIDTTGLFRATPLHQASAVRLSHILADVDSAVKKYLALAPGWGTSTTRLFMAGHSAGAILTGLYVQGDFNNDGHILAGANWAGSTDFSIPHDSVLTYIPPFLKELLYRWSGAEVTTANNLAFMSISAYWQANKNGGRPMLSAYPENNLDSWVPGYLTQGYDNTVNFHTLLRSRGVAERFSFYAGEHHGLDAKPETWPAVIKETAGFFKAR